MSSSNLGLVVKSSNYSTIVKNTTGIRYHVFPGMSRRLLKKVSLFVKTSLYGFRAIEVRGFEVKGNKSKNAETNVWIKSRPPNRLRIPGTAL